MLRYFVALLAILSLFGATIISESTEAIGLRIAPLSYEAEINGEIVDGYIDINNPDDRDIVVKASVQAYRQIDNSGGLRFYDDPRISASFELPEESINIASGETFRVPFSILPDELPEGSVLASVFFTSDPADQTNGIGQRVQVGTIFVLQNGEVDSKSAEISAFSLPSISFDTTIRGSYSIKNTTSSSDISAFYPEVTISIGERKKVMKGSLISNGVERSNQFTVRAPGPGLHRVSATYGASTQSKWILILPMYFILSLISIASLIIALVIYVRKRRSRSVKEK